jgi:hypothetical protein
MNQRTAKRMRSHVQPEKSGEGHVYILTSPVSEHIKIGGTDHAPMKRIREINSCEPYKLLGPWSLFDFRQVSDWRAVERSLHYKFRSKLVRNIAGQKELFALAAAQASKELGVIEPSLIVRKPKVDRMFQDQEFSTYIQKLLSFTGILNWLDLQGAWTFSLFPSTSGSRYFTMNIGTHEVAFSSGTARGASPTHMIHMDRLIRDFKDVKTWLRAHSGELVDDNYASALDRSTSVFFGGSFDIALEFLALTGVRRAIIAYWTEALIGLQERESTSVHSRHHNWNAVSELKRRLRGI